MTVLSNYDFYKLHLVFELLSFTTDFLSGDMKKDTLSNVLNQYFVA